MQKPVVTVREGKLLGKVQNDIDGNPFYSFQGIPYAKPPLGELRFKAPQPPEKWKGIRDATEDGSECYSKQFTYYVGSEDCLFLNVFTKEISSSRLRPVMFWIHGGAFTKGSNTTKVYGPQYLIREDIVLVTINYRLGPLGFLSLPDPEAGVPGNAGFKDMVMALKWVQNNIKKFSGNPKNVTIFGDSAGATAVHLLVLSPMAKGLFHKAIAQSGCATNRWARTNKIASRLFAQRAGIYSNDDKEVLKHLQQLTLEELQEAMEKTPELFRIGELFPYGPVIETNSKEPAFLSRQPADIIKSGKYNKVPMIMGCVSKEGMYVYHLCCSDPDDNFVLLDETILPRSMGMRTGSNIHKQAAHKVKKFYFGDHQEPHTDRETIYKLYTDNYFLYEVYKTAKEHLKNNRNPIYFYRFLYDTDLNFLKLMADVSDPGACHGDDCAYLFKTDFLPEFDKDSIEDIAVRRFVRLWTNFAKYGRPTLDNNDPLLPVNWLPITKDKFNILDIGEQLKLHDEHPETEYMQFWDDMHKINPYSSKL